MNDTTTTLPEKTPIQSATLIGLLITTLATLLQVSGVVDISIGEQTTLVDAIVALANGAGIVLAIYGRITANSKIVLTKSV